MKLQGPVVNAPENRPSSRDTLMKELTFSTTQDFSLPRVMVAKLMPLMSNEPGGLLKLTPLASTEGVRISVYTDGVANCKIVQIGKDRICHPKIGFERNSCG